MNPSTQGAGLNHQLLFEIAEKIRRANDPEDLLFSVAEAVGGFLQVRRCLFNEIDLDRDRETVHRDYCRGVESVAGVHLISHYSSVTTSDMISGKTVVNRDSQSDPRTAEFYEQTYAPLGERAYVAVPLLRDGRWVASLWVSDDRPRVWSDAEVSLLEMTAERAWLAVEKMRSEATLRESEERYRTLFNSIDEGFCVCEMLVDAEGNPYDYRFLEVNPTFEKQSGLENAKGRTARELVPNLEGHWFQIYGKVALEGEPVRFIDGSEVMNRWFDVYAFRIGFPHERKFAVLFNNITERRRAEAEVAQLSARNRDILESITDGFCALDQNWCFIYVNRQAEKLLDREPGDLLGKVIWDVYPGLHGSEFQQAYLRAANERVSSTVTAYYPDHERWYEVHVYPAPNGITIYFRNVTVRKQIEAEREKLLHREQELRQTAEEANRLKDEFLATVSHELRTPLTSILGWSSLLQRGDFDAETRARALETIQRNAHAQQQIIDDLLEVSRIITGKLRIETNAVDLVPVVEAALDTVRPAAAAKNIHLRAALDLATGPIAGDASRLQQVVWNLLTNAVKFTPPAGLIEITLTGVGSHAEITVSDNGDGIEADFLPYVFDRFRQADGTTRRAHGGLGLGLAIVRHLVEAHGGSVHVSSQGKGLGATFSIKLPLLPAVRTTNDVHQVAPSASITKEPGGASPSRALAGVHVLLVDDDDDARDLLAILLSGHGAEVMEADSASAALTLFRQRRPDVLVSDIGMPTADGYDLIRQIRETEGGLRTPAAALTAYARTDDRDRALAAGYDLHLPKPVEPATAVAAIAELAGKSPTVD